MKHLKVFEEFSVIGDLRDLSPYISDILLYAQDIDDISVSDLKIEFDILSFDIIPNNEGYPAEITSEIMDIIIRCYEYSKLVGYKMESNIQYDGIERYCPINPDDYKGYRDDLIKQYSENILEIGLLFDNISIRFYKQV